MKPTNKNKRKPILLAIVGAVLLIGTGYFAVDYWLATTDISETNETSVPDAPKAKREKRREGRDETPIKPDMLASYSVAATKPRALYIDKIGVESRIMPMGVNDGGSMQAPVNIYDAGWYTGSAEPSQGGALAIDGHASGPTKQGLFGRLDELVVGDKVRLETGDGTSYTYEVVHKEDLRRNEVDMKKFLLPYGRNLKGLNLMTCGGEWEEAEQTFANRVVVYTKLVSA